MIAKLKHKTEQITVDELWKLPKKERERIIKEQAKMAADLYNNNQELFIDYAGDIVEH